jgi:hypothetical protein
MRATLIQSSGRIEASQTYSVSSHAGRLSSFVFVVDQLGNRFLVNAEN